MSTRWMRWNTTTHIFEYSTDGVVFNPLPLDAAILTEGSLDPALLPGGLPSLSSPNVYTGTPVPISLENAGPILQYKETDAAVDQKYWRVAVDSGMYQIQKLSDALGGLTNLLTIDRNGVVTVQHLAGGYQAKFLSSVNDIARFHIRNSSAGNAAITSFDLGNDQADSRSAVFQLSSGYPSAGPLKADYLHIRGNLGLSIYCPGATGTFYVHTGASNAERFKIDQNGSSFFNSEVQITNPTNAHTLILSGTVVSGTPSAGIRFFGLGIQHAAMAFTPETGNKSRIAIGTTPANIANMNKTITVLDPFSLADTGTFDLPGANAWTGFLLITSTQGAEAAIFALRGGSGSTQEVSDPSATYSNASGTASMTNIFYNAGTTSYRIENRRGATRAYHLAFIGIGG